MSSSLVRKSLELVESELDNRARKFYVLSLNPIISHVSVGYVCNCSINVPEPLKKTRKNELLKDLKVKKKKCQIQTKRVLGGTFMFYQFEIC